jgi:hypothetical protein
MPVLSALRIQGLFRAMKTVFEFAEIIPHDGEKQHDFSKESPAATAALVMTNNSNNSSLVASESLMGVEGVDVNFNFDDSVTV